VIPFCYAEISGDLLSVNITKDLYTRCWSSFWLI